MAGNSYFSIVTLNINGLNAPRKRHGISHRIKKKNRTQPYAVYTRLILDLRRPPH